MLKSLKGSGIKTRMLNPVDEFWDRRLGVRTFGFRPAVGGPEQGNWRAHYVPTPYRRVLRTLRHVNVGPDDVFVDLGCGLGRTVFTASWLGVRKAVGVEIDPELVASAQASHRNSRLARQSVEFLCTPAEAYSPEDMTVLFMFHPFGESTMRDVVRALEASLTTRPRHLRVVYENPIHFAVLDESSSLKRTGSWTGRRFGSPYAVNFWESVAR